MTLKENWRVKDQGGGCRACFAENSEREEIKEEKKAEETDHVNSSQLTIIFADSDFSVSFNLLKKVSVPVLWWQPR